MKNALSVVAVFFASALNAQTMNEGLMAMQMEEWDKAITIYSALAKSNDQAAILALGNAHLAKNDKAKALDNFKKAFDAKPEGAYAFVANGRVLMLEGKPAADVIKQFDKAAKAGKKDVDALRSIGESYLYGSGRDLKTAEERLKNAYEFKTKDYNTLLQLGYCYKEMPNGGLAAQHYEFAQAVEPTNPFAFYMQARVYRQAKLPEQFVKQLDKTIGVDKGYTLALRAKAEYWYFTKRNYEKALVAYEDLTKNGREFTIDDEMQLANCYFLTKKYKECIALVEKIISKDGSKNYLRRLLGYCYYETGEHQKAYDILKDYFMKVTPEKIIASDHQYYGNSIIKTKGDTALAITNYRKAMVMDSSLWPLHKEIGGLFFTQKKFCDAAPEYLMYFDSVQKPEAMDYYRLGSSYYSCREDSMRYQKALAAYIKVTELVPTASIGWFWSGKSAAKLDPDMAANPEKAAEFGKATPYFEKYVGIVSVDQATKDKNKKDLVAALEYLTYAYYLKVDVANFQVYANKLIEVDPENATAKGLMDEFNSNGGKIVPNTTPVPTSNPGGTPMPGTPNKSGGGGKN